MSENAYFYRFGCYRTRTCDIRRVKAAVYKDINELGRTSRIETALYKEHSSTKGAHAPELIRAVIRCECPSCGNHKQRCRHIAGRRVSKTRHPVVLHRIDGRVICHLCLNRSLELQRRRLYPDVIPLGVR